MTDAHSSDIRTLQRQTHTPDFRACAGLQKWMHKANSPSSATLLQHASAQGQAHATRRHSTLQSALMHRACTHCVPAVCTHCVPAVCTHCVQHVPTVCLQHVPTVCLQYVPTVCSMYPLCACSMYPLCAACTHCVPAVCTHVGHASAPTYRACSVHACRTCIPCKLAMLTPLGRHAPRAPSAMLTHLGHLAPAAPCRRPRTHAAP